MGAWRLRKLVAAVLAALSALSVPVACSDSANSSSTNRSESFDNVVPVTALDRVIVAEVRDQAVAAVEERLSTAHPQDDPELTNPFVFFALWSLSVRFGLEEFSELRSEALELVDTSSPDARVQLRLLKPGHHADPEDLQNSDRLNRIVGEALNCDAPDQPDIDLGSMWRSVRAGGYIATHAGIALETRLQLGCSTAGTEPIRDALLEQWRVATSAPVRTRIIESRPDEVDLLFEQISFLTTLGGRSELTDGMVLDVINARGVDNMWSSLHTTQLAIAIMSTWLGEDTGADVVS